jgi:hypothetical protein
MARARRKTPEQLEAERQQRRALDLDAVNVPTDAASLPHGQDIEVTRAGQKRGGQKVTEDSVRRLDAFTALKDGMNTQPRFHGCYDAARRFELDILLRRGEADRGQASQRVDRTAGLVTDAMIDAAKRVEAVVARLPPRDWWLLMELIKPSTERSSWRESVEYVTGETNPHAQCGAVRSSCANLRDAYAAIEREALGRRKAA